MHNFYNSYYLFYLGLTLLVSAMFFWFRDVVAEGTENLSNSLKSGINFTQSNYRLSTARAIPIEDISKALNTYKANNINKLTTTKNLGYYLAGILEGDGHISIPALGITTLNRILNPRIVFTSHVNKLSLYAFIQSELSNVGCFQATGKNAIRYIIGDKKGILLFINLVHGKLRTPKNKRFNDLIEFFNTKYSLNIPESLLDNSNFPDNSWFTDFTEADGLFDIKHVERKCKSHSRRSVSEKVSLRFRLDWINVYMISLHLLWNLLWKI